MRDIFRPPIGECLFAYLDDITIFSPDNETHWEDLRKTFRIIEGHNLTVKPSKCVFFQPKVNVLGFIVSEAGVKSNPEKVTAIKSMAPPRNAKEMRRLLGMTNYYRTHIQEYAKMVYPLQRLTNNKYEWTEKCEESFQQLKHALSSSPVITTCSKTS